MPSISVTEDDFSAVAEAATDAFETGRTDIAKQLDKIARKINLALSMAKYPPLGAAKESRSWKDMPSVLPPKVMCLSGTIRTEVHHKQRDEKI